MRSSREEHDAAVARRGRSYTDFHMRSARQVDDDATSQPLSPHERVIADSRRALGLTK